MSSKQKGREGRRYNPADPNDWKIVQSLLAEVEDDIDDDFDSYSDEEEDSMLNVADINAQTIFQSTGNNKTENRQHSHFLKIWSTILVMIICVFDRSVLLCQLPSNVIFPISTETEMNPNYCQSRMFQAPRGKGVSNVTVPKTELQNTLANLVDNIFALNMSNKFFLIVSALLTFFSFCAL
ncbi:hypothetical protein C0J52_01923 [Blattella germanica]|nr:hypothetical protein C0J52_01923 [Blattella germanica]